jgi:GT2 family glycosyltransferase
MTNSPDVAVIIVNWNTRELLRDCLRSIRADAGPVQCHVIVVDNASTDGSAEMVARDFPDVQLIASTENRGYAAAINRGLARAQGRYCLVLNSDIIVCEGAIHKTVAWADEHPDVGVLGCQVRVDRSEVQMTCFRFPSVLGVLLQELGLAKTFKHNRFFGRDWMLWWSRDSTRAVDVVSGMFLLVRQTALQQVGPMDESYFLFFEETDWCYRFARAGWKRVFWPGAWVIHRHGGGLSQKRAGARILVQYQKSALIFFKKHRSLAAYALVRGMLGVRCLVRGVTWSLRRLGRVIAGRDSEQEKQQALAFWACFRFCLTGREA